MFKNRDSEVKNRNDTVASGLSLATADQISTGFRAVKIFVFEVQQLIDTHSTGQKIIRDGFWGLPRIIFR